jgi:hypothetical protein
MGSIINKKFIITAAHCFCGANSKASHGLPPKTFCLLMKIPPFAKFIDTQFLQK